jgi:hypothetical protein
MSDLLTAIIDTFPANNDVGVPLQSTITITLNGVDYDTSSLTDGFFVEGPDTDQYIGPGLFTLSNPDNISQGDIDDFLQSPNYAGIVSGTTTVSGISGNTVISFVSDKPLSPLIEYTVNLSNVLETDGLTTVSGFATFSFTTGSGSIEEVPSTISSSILADTNLVSLTTSAGLPFKIIGSTPTDRSAQNSTELSEIIIEFNKDIDASSVDVDQILVQTLPATGHPNVAVTTLGDLAKSITVDGNRLRITI